MLLRSLLNLTELLPTNLNATFTNHNDKGNCLGKWSLKKVYFDQSSTFEKLVKEKGHYLFIIRISKVYLLKFTNFINGLSPNIVESVFHLK